MKGRLARLLLPLASTKSLPSAAYESRRFSALARFMVWNRAGTTSVNRAKARKMRSTTASLTRFRSMPDPLSVRQ